MQDLRSGRTHLLWRTVVVVAAFGLLLAACGGGGTAGTSGTTDGGEESPEPTDDMTSDTEPVECEIPGTCEPPADILAAAQEEGKFVWYSSLALDLQESLATAFEAKYGIQVDFSRGGSEEVAERAQVEIQSGNNRIDGFGMSDIEQAQDAADLDGLAALMVEEIPNLAAIADDERLFHDHFMYWGGAAFVAAYNTDLAPDGVDSWCDFLDPKWKGQIGSIWREGLRSAHLVYKTIEETCGEGSLEKLAEQDVTYWTSTTQSVQALAAGEYAVTPQMVSYILDEQKSNGAPVEWVALETVTISPRYESIAENAPHPNASRVWMNFLLSEEAQSLAYGDQLGVSVLGPDVVPDAIELPDTWYIAEPEYMTDEEMQEIAEALGRL